MTLRGMKLREICISERFFGGGEGGLKFIPLTLDFPFRLVVKSLLDYSPADGEFGTTDCFQSPRPSRCYLEAGLFKMAAMVNFQKDLISF